MKDIIVVFVFGIITYGIYKLFDLFVRRKERLALIERMGNPSSFNQSEWKLYLPLSDNPSFTALKLGSLIFGMGLGILVGFFICSIFIEGYATGSDLSWKFRNQAEIVYIACLLLFGGFGLLVAFVIELLYCKKNKKS